MPKTRKAREEAGSVRARVERAAMQLFAQRGSAAVSVQAIADAVSMSKQAVLYHYRSKDAIWRAVMDQVTQRVRSWVADFLAAPAPLTLEDTCERVLDAWMSDPFVPAVILREVLESGSPAADLLEEGTLPWREQVRALLLEGQRQGSVRPEVDVDRWFDRIALMLLTSLALPARSEPPTIDDPDREEMRSKVLETLRIALVSVLVDPSAALAG